MNHSAGTPAPRPSPEAIYERLNDYFPTHDLDNAGVGTLANSADFTSAAAPVSGVRPVFRWVRGELIGKGTSGRVYLALNSTTGEMIAAKQIEIARTGASRGGDARPTGASIDLYHPNLVQYLGFEETPTLLSIFMEYVPGGSIATCLRKYGPFNEDVTRSFTSQILSGLEYLHSQGFLHRYLKGDNVLVETDGTCKLSDFDLHKRADNVPSADPATTMHGALFWMAPEVVNATAKYSSNIDIWSAGCVAHEMWTAQWPWFGQEALQVLIHLQTKQAPPLPEGVELSMLADDFRKHCFTPDPDDRPSAAELREHPYLQLPVGWTFTSFK
ncbi:kinase-like protein [Trametes versicolor FP-101664 SS1]|uniref:kinase-like protein n=1 Tax=Trametes versicolor (strain FP-101664) TaxID=717944 RepID=UPI0004622824|nr:kinase-like protein [Trametes versicolor FP-101664 SS1]EIW53105.1 kinase-like protein [Trametes versicolor FP-101664 SS1]